MSQQTEISQFLPSKENIFFDEKSKRNLIEYIDLSKGKMITLLKIVFSFLNDNSLLRKDSSSSFQKYILDNKLIQTMSKVFYFYSSNFPENGKITLHELLKEKYTKLKKYYEQNINYISNSTELSYRVYQVQGLTLLWLIETKYDSEYYDEFIRLVNCLIKLDENNKSDNSEKNYLNNFLNMIIKFPFIKQNKEIIIKILEVNECNDSVINYFNENLNDYIKDKNSNFKQNIFDDKSGINIGKKNIKTKNENSYFSLIQNNSSISHKRKSYSNVSSNKGLLSTINSSGFYTPEFKHSKRDSIRHFRRFTINNINNPKISISNKSENYSRSNSINEMNNLLVKCEEGKRKNIIVNTKSNKITKSGPQSTKSKLRLAVQGHFYTEDDYKNNIDMNGDSSSINSIDTEIINNDIKNVDDNNIYIKDYDFTEDNIISDNENEIENKIVSVDELPINANMSIISSSNGKNIGIEPENIIQETKEEEEIDENEQINDKNNNTNNDSNYVKILTDNEIKDFFSQQFSDNKKLQKNKKNNINNNNNKTHNIKIHHNKNKKRNNSSNDHNSNSSNSSRNNSFNNNLVNDKKNEIINKDRQNSKKNINISSNLIKNKSKNKENNNISVQEKMKNYSNNNVFGMIKNQKNKRKEKVLVDKNNNLILEPCTKGKELMNEALNNNNIGNNISKERLPTDSVAKKNLLSLYQQLKAKK